MTPFKLLQRKPKDAEAGEPPRNLSLQEVSIVLTAERVITNLIGQAMQRAGKAIHGSAEGQIGVRQGTAHQVAGVGADIASFMVTVRAGGTIMIKTTWQSLKNAPGFINWMLEHRKRRFSASKNTFRVWK